MWLVKPHRESIVYYANRKWNHASQMNAEPIDDVFRGDLSCRPKASEHEISIELADDFLMAKMDVRLIVQVIINIVNNAIKYTPEGSHLFIGAKGEKMVLIRIADDGQAFQMKQSCIYLICFYTADIGKADSRRGLGLGLSLCKSIVDAHGGKISVSNNKPHGAVFTFTLPLEEVNFDHV